MVSVPEVLKVKKILGLQREKTIVSKKLNDFFAFIPNENFAFRTSVFQEFFIEFHGVFLFSKNV